MSINREILIRLLKIQFDHNQRIDIMTEAGIDAEVLRLDLLTVVLDAIGLPAESQDSTTDRDEIWTHYVETVETGSCNEIEDFLTWAYQIARFNTLADS